MAPGLVGSQPKSWAMLQSFFIDGNPTLALPLLPHPTKGNSVQIMNKLLLKLFYLYYLYYI